MDAVTQRIEAALMAELPGADVRPAALHRAMRWAVEGGGKRLRPRMCLAAAVAAGGSEADALLPACAIEFLHSYTLVHDDLPAMDDDRLRRGKASVWAEFGEANGVLAGDALQALAFSVAARSPRNASRVVAVLGAAALGVVRGQVEDLDELASSGRDRLDFVFRHKTADLFEAAVRMGAAAADAPREVEDALAVYAVNFGRAFQFADDLDADDGEKSFTCLSVMSREEATAEMAAARARARSALVDLSGDASALAALLG